MQEWNLVFTRCYNQEPALFSHQVSLGTKRRRRRRKDKR
jgi:hypothetical protein